MSVGATSRPVAVYLPVEGLDVEPGRRLLREAGFEVHQMPSPEPDEDTPREAYALLCGYDPVGAELMDRFAGLRVVATHSDGFDMVDLDAARQRGIWVCHLPDSANEEVAVHALGLTLSLLRQLPEWHRRARAGQWVEDTTVWMPRPSVLTCGVIGVGRIGRRYADLARHVFGTVLGVDPYVDESDWPSGVGRARLDEAFAACDVVSLHVPLTEETANLASAARLESMPYGALLVNTARGSLVDEEALAGLLARGHLAGAGLDVLTVEPPGPGNPLLTAPHVLLSPHVGYLSRESVEDYAREPANNVLATLREGRPLTPVPSGD